MIHLVFLLEEPSAREMLHGVLPRLLPENEYNYTFRYIVFEGKQDLEKNLVRKIRSYRIPGSLFIVLRDQDAGDCQLIKDGLLRLCQNANQPEALVRIACREIESWYLADLIAVEAGLEIPGISRYQNKRKYRNPDYLHKPSEEIRLLTGNRYQKVSGSRSIGPYLALDNTRSNSYKVFIEGIRRLASNQHPASDEGRVD